MTSESASPRRRLPRWRLLASPLTRRILAVNLLAPVVLVAGLLYLDRYKQGLIRAELEGLGTHAEMVAAAIGEGAVFEEEKGFLEINHDMAQCRRLAPTHLSQVPQRKHDVHQRATHRFHLGMACSHSLSSRKWLQSFHLRNVESIQS